MPKAKKFIDKKRAVSFQLVHRSQQDPLVADEDAPQMVLVPKPNPNQEKKHGFSDTMSMYSDFMQDPEHLPHLKSINDNHMEWPSHVDEELEERRKKITLQLPPEVFPSLKEEKEGMLSKAAPTPKLNLNLDPDLVAAMDEDFDFSDEENQLEDNFVELAEGLASDEEIGSEFELKSDDEDYEDGDELNSLHSFEQEEKKSRFTNYSMSSSVIRRNEQLRLLDERFEKAYEEYDDEKLGAMEGEEIVGHIPSNSSYLLELAEQYQKEQQRHKLEENDDQLRDRTIELFNNQGEDEMVYVEVEKPLQYDCETILSTYSNKYNRPRTIVVPKPEKIKIHNRTGIPLDVLDENQITEKNLKQLNTVSAGIDRDDGGMSVKESVISQLSELSIRPKGETPEERRIRKQNLKAYKKERREEKKANKEAFKQQSIEQTRINMNVAQNRARGIFAAS